MKLVAALLIMSTLSATLKAEDKPLEVGATAPDWKFDNWLNSTPLELKTLRGKVVLIRWWTAPSCPYCRATAPALNEFYEKYHDKGLQVIGAYHHKAAAPLDVDEVKKHAGEYGFKFPVAVDPEWGTLKRWWLAGDQKKWTSVTFLLDREGVVRFIHPGGQYVKGDENYAALQAKIEELLKP
jgi:peroxiredoxin